MVDMLTLGSEKVGRTGIIYFKVPEEDQERAKELGAVFDDAAGVWKFTGDWADYINFFDWMRIGDAVCFALDYIYIIEGEHTCAVCGKKTPVIGLVICDLLQVFEEEPDEYSLEPLVDKEELHLAWAEDESEIPPALLGYVKEHYHVGTRRDKLGYSCFGNVCKHCGAEVNNFDLFLEESVLNPVCVSYAKAKQGCSKLKVKKIPIGSSMPLVWQKSFGGHNSAYLEFGRVEELDLVGMDMFVRN